MNSPTVRHLGIQPYLPIWQAMQQFTDQRTAQTADEIWILQHFPVFTLGLNGRAEFIYDAGDIPVIPVDRGGQVTYHGPGQLVVYLLIDLKRRGLGIRALISLLETTIIQTLQTFDISSYAKPEAPGVYVAAAKIAAVGLRVRRGCSYHGLSFNIDMDLSPFARIAPCGYPQLAVTQLKALQPESADLSQVSHLLQSYLMEALTPHDDSYYSTPP